MISPYSPKNYCSYTALITVGLTFSTCFYISLEPIQGEASLGQGMTLGMVSVLGGLVALSFSIAAIKRKENIVTTALGLISSILFAVPWLGGWYAAYRLASFFARH